MTCVTEPATDLSRVRSIINERNTRRGVPILKSTYNEDARTSSNTASIKAKLLFPPLLQLKARDVHWPHPVYMLAGLVENSGTMRRGHYVAYIRGDDKERRDSSVWYRASDSFVRTKFFVLRRISYSTNLSENSQQASIFCCSSFTVCAGE
ncbi:hypothetical protein YC2023_049833 [Brassica napus]